MKMRPSPVELTDAGRRFSRREIEQSSRIHKTLPSVELETDFIQYLQSRIGAVLAGFLTADRLRVGCPQPTVEIVHDERKLAQGYE